MSLSDEQIKKLLEWFKRLSNQNRNYGQKRKRGLDKNHQWIQPNVIQSMPDEELEEKFLEYYKSGTGNRQNLIQLNRNKIIRNKEQFRKTALYLLDESIDLRVRLENVLNGEYHINGFGKALATALLMDYSPTKYCLWNNKTDDGFNVLGWDVYESKDTVGEAYVKVLVALKKLKNLRPDLNLTLLEVDNFLHTIAAENEGIEMVRRIREGDPSTEFNELFGTIFDNYLSAKVDSAVKETVRNTFNKLKTSFENISAVQANKDLLVKFGTGIGSMANNPWIAIMNRNLTTTTQEGIYCVYIFRADMSGAYLTFNQGVGKKASTSPTRAQITEVHKNALLIREYCQWLSQHGFRLDEMIDLKDTGLTGKAYEESTIAYKFYDRHNFPVDREFEKDLEKLLEAYQEYVDRGNPADKAAWIFQCNLKVFDVISALKHSNVDSWSVFSHKEKIKKADKFILWVTGEKSGCYALGTITSDAYERSDNEIDLEYSSEPDANAITLRVDLSPEIVLLENPITKEEVQSNAVLKNLKVGYQGTNFSATKEQFNELWEIAKEHQANVIERHPPNPKYTLDQLSTATGFDLDELSKWARAVKRKGQVIFYGPPGTGKTFVAEHFARHLISGNDGFDQLVQFHPAYAYEDFIQGIRPQTNENGQLDYPTIPGRFLEFCEKAKKRNGTCVLIIDEINRANLARVFGELMYLLEYRDREVPLSSGGSLSIPENAILIGTMNTADRSIALVDHALRRRFAFIALYPNYNILREFHNESDFDVNPLINVLEQLNTEINDRHYEIGLTYFLKKNLRGSLEDIWKMEIEPYLEEYFFDRQDKVEEFGWSNVADKILQ